MAKFKVGDLIADSVKTVARIRIVDVIKSLYEIEIVSTGDPAVRLGNVQQYDIQELDSICHIYEEQKPALPQYEPLPRPEMVTMRDAFLFEIESARPRHTGQAKTWHSEGRCPQCGELGRFHLSAPICSKHGVY